MLHAHACLRQEMGEFGEKEDLCIDPHLLHGANLAKVAQHFSVAGDAVFSYNGMTTGIFVAGSVHASPRL